MAKEKQNPTPKPLAGQFLLCPPEGNALWTAAAITVLRKKEPRDGGHAFGALADWVFERFSEGAATVLLADTEGSGLFLCVSREDNGDWPTRVAVFDPTNDGDNDDVMSRRADNFKDGAGELSRGLSGLVYAAWRMGE